MTILYFFLATIALLFVVKTFPDAYERHKYDLFMVEWDRVIANFKHAMIELGDAVQETNKQMALFVEHLRPKG